MCLGPRQTFMVALHNYPLNSFEHLSIVILLKHLYFQMLKFPVTMCVFIYIFNLLFLERVYARWR